jgi:cytochrome d ubiquinol oxidase subunit I
MDNVTLARATMGSSLGFHIVFAVLGVGFPVLIAAAEGIGLRRRDQAWMDLARRWARAFGILFAVGAVSGTTLSFELGLLWPRFMAFSGSIIGLPFSAEGFAFFLEAIFLGLYLYGWQRLSPLTHWLCSIPIILSGAASAWFVVTANAWMNMPAGFRVADGQVVQVDPLRAMFNPATPTETLHVLASAYAVTGFCVAAVYAAGMLKGRIDALHQRALPLAMLMAALATPLLGITGDASARFDAHREPAKLAALEAVFHTQRGAPLHIGGIPNLATGRTDFAIEIPRGLSLFAFFDPDAEVTGLDAFRPEDRPNPIPVHLAFQLMVVTGFGLGFLSLAYWIRAWRRRAFPTSRSILWALVVAGPASVVAMESGWIVTEMGRQPWIVHGVIRTADAATSAPGLAATFGIFIAIYVALAVTCARLLLALARRERQQATPPFQPRPTRDPA